MESNNNENLANVAVLNATPSESKTDSKCPSCGATLAYDPSTNSLICNFCGMTVPLKTMPAAPGFGYTIAELQENAGRHLWQTSSKLITCGTCGGKFIADPSSISGLCPFCGSNSVSQTEVNGVPEPTAVVPFAIDKAKAQEMLKQWLSTQRRVPADVLQNTQFNDLEGVYIPYWVFNCDTRTPYKGKFGITTGTGEDARTTWHKGAGVCDLPFKDLTYLASERLVKDRYWNAISKFNFNLAKRYDPNLLAGFWAESYTIDGPQCWQNAMNDIYAKIKNEIRKMELADCVDKLEMQPEATNIRAKYILAPIWITSFNYNGQTYRTLINGQSGEVIGKWPKRRGKWWLIPIIVLGVLTLKTILDLLIG